MSVKLLAIVLTVAVVQGQGWFPVRRRLNNGADISYPYDAKEWGKVAPLCETGKLQSPIDLPKQVDGLRQENSLVYEHKAATKMIPVAKHQKAHSLTFKVQHGKDQPKVGHMLVNGEKFYLRQWHLHTGSEHTINGKQYDLEMHKVHTTEDGKKYAVIGIMFESIDASSQKAKTSKSVAAMEEVLSLFPFSDGTVTNWNTLKNGELDLTSIGGSYELDKFTKLLDDKRYWEYTGSLTTPGCNEGVRWHNMMDTLEVTSAQIAKIQSLSGFDKNFRAVQPLNERYIYPVAASTWAYPYDADKWGVVSKTCKEGKSQSPVNLPKIREGLKQKQSLVYEHKTSTKLRVNSHPQGGHSLHFDVDETSHMMVNSEKFILRQFHIHTGSENRIDGKQYAVEMHKVHTNADNSKYAVIGIMFDEVSDAAGKGKKSVIAWQKIIDMFGFKEGTQDNWLTHLPDGKLPVGQNGYNLDTFLELLDPLRYWSYTGSLTTPNCNEGVAWHSMMDPLPITKSQVEALKKISGFSANFRPPQALNGRTFLPDQATTIQDKKGKDSISSHNKGNASAASVLSIVGSFVISFIVSLLF